MNNEEMFLTILEKMDTMETGITSLNSRMDKVETGLTSLNSRIDELESNMDLEFYAVRTEMDVMNKSLKTEINILNDKVDRLMFTKDVEGYDKINARFEVLEKGYRELREKIV